MTKVSVVVCARNAEKTIKECVESVLTQSFKDFELIVVDDGSTDSTKEILKKFQSNSKVKLFFQTHKGIASARNTGIHCSSGEFVAFIDSDCIAEKNWLEELLKSFSDKISVSSGGPNRTPKNRNQKGKNFGLVLDFFSKTGSSYVKNSNKLIEVSHNPSCNSIYRSRILKEFNGFNERLSSNEDPELDFRIKRKGYKIVFNPKAIVFHYRKDSFKKVLKQAFWFGKGRMQAIKLHLGMAEWFRLIPSLFLALLFISFILSFLKESFL
jgi:glycosyltransferase involved in cell wall biosynthesis